MEEPKIIRLQLLGGSTEDWSEGGKYADLILKEREPAINTDTGEVKYGDGEHAWKDLINNYKSTKLYLHEVLGASKSYESDYNLFFICNTASQIPNYVLPAIFNDRALSIVINQKVCRVIVVTRFSLIQDVISAVQTEETSALLTFADGSTKQVDFAENNIGSYTITAL